MDDRMKDRVQGVVEQLLKEEKSSLRKVQTWLEIENQAIEIGDELVRQLANTDLSERAEKVAQKVEHGCPDCGRVCGLEADTEPLILQGKRSEIEYSEPRCHCRSCRRVQLPRNTTSSSLIGRRVFLASLLRGNSSARFVKRSRHWSCRRSFGRDWPTYLAL